MEAKKIRSDADHHTISRRSLLKGLAATAATMVALPTACVPQPTSAPTATPAPAPLTATPAPAMRAKPLDGETVKVLLWDHA
ncbi:MAG: twin-arginine translocation signal domain-containing protein, partial [Anaerolineae bacterium]|nr:twin-arginine translocation signal domain-containing protein [Anaerolineae bacterium]